MKLTFDTNVLLSATLWEGSVAQKLLFAAIKKRIKIFSSPDILAEYQRILLRDFDYSADEIRNIMEKVLFVVMIVVPQEKLSIVEKDPSDNRILECAFASGSDYIVSYDRHLLDLQKVKTVIIMRPEELLRKIREK